MASAHHQDPKNEYSPRTTIPLIALTLFGSVSLALVLMIVLWV